LKEWWNKGRKGGWSHKGWRGRKREREKKMDSERAEKEERERGREGRSRERERQREESCAGWNTSAWQPKNYTL
jgi:hypothetical protein